MRIYSYGVGLMKSLRRYILTFIALLAFTAAVRADMMPVSHEDPVCRQSPASNAEPDLQYENLSGLANPDSLSFELLPEADAQIGQTSDLQQLQSLTDGPNSLKFCLSALISLGICCSAQWIKKISLGFVPEWYHEGGPFQIGHSHALMSGTLCPAHVYCFVQPFRAEDNNLPRYFLKTIVSFWRKSQFTPVVLASRGPPEIS